MEQTTVGLLHEAGVGAGVASSRIPHHSFELVFSARRHPIDVYGLIGWKLVTANGQTEVTRDLMEARAAAGLETIYEATEVAIHDFDGTKGRIQPRVTWKKTGNSTNCMPTSSLGATASTRSAGSAFWDERWCIDPELADNIITGPSIEKSIAPLRNFGTEPMRFGSLFLAGDACHIVPPTGAKGLNLAASDVKVLSGGLIQHCQDKDAHGLDTYSERALRRI